MSWEPVLHTALEAARGENPEYLPTVAWFRTQKGRGYGKQDAASHGLPHPLNSEAFWATRESFQVRYGISYEGAGEAAPDEAVARQAQAVANLQLALSALTGDEATLRWLTDRLAELAASVPGSIEGCTLGGGTAAVFDDPAITDYRAYPPELYKDPGERQPNRAALGTWGAWVNAYTRERYGRPLIVACSADLAESTNVAGFAKDFGDMRGWGWYERDANPRGTVLPQEITEMANAGILAGMASVSFASDPRDAFDGFWGACSTYGSFSYLKYGPLRLFSQMAQDTELKLGKVIWIAGHSGPETAEDSRTHFGIFETGVTQLFPQGAVIDLHPWEHNEVPVVLGAALAMNIPIVALHLTRPPVPIPDREALGIPSHFEAARGAYVMRAFRDDGPAMGTIFVRGTVPTANLVSLIPELDRAGLNVKVVAAISPQLFRAQDRAYREATVGRADPWDAMAITSGARRLMADWIIGPVAEEYSLSADRDDRWRTGGSVDEVMDEAGLSADHILAGIERFVRERAERLTRIRAVADAVARDR